MKIRWTQGALFNLEQAAAYIAQDNPQAAAAIVTAIWKTVQTLRTFPMMGKPWRLPDVYSVGVARTPYSIRYRLTEEGVEIIRVHHNCRRWES
ncbi:MAG: type II toxin-antitoxin system RelE/ParE family toxin [Vampirovibrionales bacterium]|nr:type II toxin-antitoxin system RelE/ParE family toxin [Vampirovibrionales bacterium]